LTIKSPYIPVYSPLADSLTVGNQAGLPALPLTAMDDDTKDIEKQPAKTLEEEEPHRR